MPEWKTGVICLKFGASALERAHMSWILDGFSSVRGPTACPSFAIGSSERARRAATAPVTQDS